MTVTSLFSLVSTMLVNRTYYVLTVVELESSLGMYVHCLLPPDTVYPLILSYCFYLRNICESSTIWSSSYVISHLCIGIKVFLR